MKNDKVISFSSFLAGLLLVKNSVGYFECNEKMHIFTETTGFDIEGDGNELELILNFEIDKLFLKRDYNEYIYNDGNVCTVAEFLYSFTDEMIRKYFNLDCEYARFNGLKKK